MLRHSGKLRERSRGARRGTNDIGEKGAVSHHAEDAAAADRAAGHRDNAGRRGDSLRADRRRCGGDAERRDTGVRGGAGVLYAGGVRVSGGGAYPRQEHGQLYDQVVLGLLHSVPRLLGFRLRADVRRRRCRRVYRAGGLLSRPIRRKVLGWRTRGLVLPDGIRGNCRHDYRGRDGGAHKDQRLLRV